MEDPDAAEKWAVQEYSSQEESGKLSWIVNKGLSVGTKVLVTGFVICSAPLVLPPLLVMSFIGFACSVPSGIFLATYACTDKLMSKLLDYGSDEEVENNGLIDEHEQAGFPIEDVQEFTKGEETEGIEVKIESIREEEEKPVTDERWVQLPVDEVRAVVVDIVGDAISGIAIEEEGAPAFAVATNVVIELCQSGDNEELARETRGLLMIDNGDEEKQSLEKPFGVAEEGDRKVEEIGNVRIEKPLKPIEPVEGLLGKRDGDNNLEAEKSKGVRVGTTNASSASKKPKVDKANVDENITNKKVQQDYQLNKEKEIVISTNADAREIADESGLDLYDNNNEGENECNVNARISSQKDLGMAFNEVMYDEEKIWQQIDAMRKIVGYKAGKQATCFEELKALYVFTGVELPASTKDPSNLLEINNKLQFLVSVVGVKQ